MEHEVLGLFLELLDELGKSFPEKLDEIKSYSNNLASSLANDGGVDDPLAGITEKRRELSESAEDIGESEQAPWMMVDDILYYRKAVELWWKEHTHAEIGDKLGISSKTIQNRMTLLRQKYGSSVVPTAAERKKKVGY